MNGRPSPLKLTVSGFAIFVASFVLSVFLFPFVALAAHDFLPRLLVNGLFFWPQLLLMPYGLRGDGFYYGYGTLSFIAATFWLLLGLAFGWLLRNLRLPLESVRRISFNSFRNRNRKRLLASWALRTRSQS